MAALLKGMMGNKWKWQWSGSRLSLLLLPQLTNASGWRWIHPWFDPSKGSCCHSLSVPLFISHSRSLFLTSKHHLALSPTLARNLTYLLLITYPLSSSSFTFSLQFHIPLSVSLLPLIFIPITFFGHSFPHFPLAYYLLYLPCPLCGFTPSISCFLLPVQAQFPPSLPFPHLCFFSFCYSSATSIP